MFSRKMREIMCLNQAYYYYYYSGIRVFFREKLKGRFLKVSFDKRVRIDLLVPLTLPTPPPSLPTPFPFSLIFKRKTTPHHPLEPDPKPLPRDTSRNSHPFLRKLHTVKTTPPFLSEFWGNHEKDRKHKMQFLKIKPWSKPTPHSALRSPP